MINNVSESASQSKYSNYHTTPVCISLCMCIYMSHTATVGCRIATDSPTPAAQGKPVFMWFNCNTGVVRSLQSSKVSLGVRITNKHCACFALVAERCTRWRLWPQLLAHGETLLELYEDPKTAFVSACCVP